jgi:hypothetical protein
VHPTYFCLGLPVGGVSFGGMATTKLSDFSIADLREMLRAAELAVGTEAESTKIIRAALERKLRVQEAIRRGEFRVPIEFPTTRRPQQ